MFCIFYQCLFGRFVSLEPFQWKKTLDIFLVCNNVIFCDLGLETFHWNRVRVSVQTFYGFSDTLSTVFITGEMIRGNKKKIGPKLFRPCILNQKSESHMPSLLEVIEGICISDFYYDISFSLYEGSNSLIVSSKWDQS